MNHKGTVTLETERLLLRRFTEADAGPAFRNWCGDREVVRFLRWAAHESLSVTQAVLYDWCRSYTKDSFYQWAIVLKETREPIGSISVVSFDDKTQKLHLGYCIGRQWWGQGFMTEALGELLRFFFEKVGVRRVEAQHDPNNPGSGAVMRKCGMTFEGTLRQADWSNQGIVDACMYSIVSEEYFRNR